METSAPLNKIIPDLEKTAELEKILLERFANKDQNPIKMITTISGSREVLRVCYDFVPLLKYKNGYNLIEFSGTIREDSFKLNLLTNEKTPVFTESEPQEYQVTIIMSDIVDYEV